MDNNIFLTYKIYKHNSDSFAKSFKKIYERITTKKNLYIALTRTTETSRAFKYKITSSIIIWLYLENGNCTIYLYYKSGKW